MSWSTLEESYLVWTHFLSNCRRYSEWLLLASLFFCWFVTCVSCILFRWVTILLVNILPSLYDLRFDWLNAHVLGLNASLFLFLNFYLCWAESTCLAVKTRVHHLVQWFQAQTKASLSNWLGLSKYIYLLHWWKQLINISELMDVQLNNTHGLVWQ